MMTGGKVILTYKRQRPPHWIAYKRKRLPSVNNFSKDNKIPDKSAKCPRYNGSTTAEKQEESTKGNKSGFPSNDAPSMAEKQEESTKDNKSECPSNNAPTSAEKQEESTEGNRSECPAKDYESYLLKHDPEEKRQFTGYIRQQTCLVSAKKASRADDKNLFVHDITQLAADSHALLEASMREGIFQKASGDRLSSDLHNPEESNSIHEAFYSYVNPTSGCDKSTMLYSVPLPASFSSGTEPRQVSLTSSNGKDYTNDLATTHELDKFNSKEPGLAVEDKSGSLSTSVTLQSKFSSPLITFCRRSKREKDANGLHTVISLGVTKDCASTSKGSESADFASAGEATPSESGCADILLNTNPLEKNLSGRVSFDAYHEKMASRDVGYSCASRSSPETGNVKQADDELENTSQDNQFTVELIPQKSVVVDFQEGLMSCSGNISNVSNDDPSHGPVLFSGHTAVGKESQSLSNDVLNTIGKTDEIPSSKSSVVSLDLSVPLPDSHDVEDCSIASVHEEQPLSSSLNSRSESHTNLNNESPGNKGSQLLHEGVGERNPLHQAQVLENGCLSEEAVQHKYNSFASSSPVAELEKNCLQLFPDDRTVNMFQSTKVRQNVTATAVSEDQTVNLFESSTQASPATTKSSLFLGLFLPMELINDGHDCIPTSSQWPNIGIQPKGFPQDTVPQCCADQASSHQRHKMVLDNIVSRARMPKRKRGGCLDLYDSPRKWSEEELDSLWVGIRRCGRGNWEVMLRDPRLHFSPWRTSRDLAEKWEEEQSKLFNTMPSSLGRHLRMSNISRDNVDGFWHVKTRKENLVDDVQLSLGDVYSQPIESVQKRSLFNFSDAQNNAPRQLQKAVTNTRTMYSCRGNHRIDLPQNNAMLDVECSFSTNQSTCMAVGGNLPHWLRETVSIPLRPPRIVPPSDTSSVSHTEMQWVKKPFIDAQVIHHEPINRMSNKHTIAGKGEQQTEAGARNSNFLSVLEHNKTEQEQYPRNKQDLIIIDSDASSEETISDDDRNAKV